MRRTLAYLPLLALAVATAALAYAGVMLRDSRAAENDRHARQGFAAAVQKGERPQIAARNIGGVLQQELAAQEAQATDRARAATWIQAAALLSLLGLGAAMTKARGKADGLAA
jgi:hypothetical protein